MQSKWKTRQTSKKGYGWEKIVYYSLKFYSLPRLYAWGMNAKAPFLVLLPINPKQGVQI